MDKTEAHGILAEQLAPYRLRSYFDLVRMIGSNDVVEVRGASGTEYQVEIEVTCDSPRDKVNVRVMGGIDDGHFVSSLAPLCDSFSMAPDGKLIGE